MRKQLLALAAAAAMVGGAQAQTFTEDFTNPLSSAWSFAGIGTNTQVGGELQLTLGRSATFSFNVTDLTSYYLVEFTAARPTFLDNNTLNVTFAGGPSSLNVPASFTPLPISLAASPGGGSFSYYFGAPVAPGAYTLTFANTGLASTFLIDDLSMTPVPEPSTYALMLAGLGFVGFMARRRKAQGHGSLALPAAA